MTEPVYLYSYGRRRHIKDPDGCVALCDGWADYDTEEAKVEELRRWGAGEARIRKVQNFPVCQRCLRAYEKAAAQ